jgi:hypothetical protein
MAFISDDVIAEVVDVIINTRDFCGNEFEAAMQFLQDDKDIRGLDATKVFRIARFRANRKWDGFRRKAGVHEKLLMG